MAGKRKPKADAPKAEAPTPPNSLIVNQLPDQDPNEALADVMLTPGARHGMVAAGFANGMLPSNFEQVGLVGARKMVETEAEKAKDGDLALASGMLMSQAITLDTMFTELARRASANLGTYIDASEKYMRMALKAQANSRMTIETLAKLHQPREQTVRHVHVGNGGQAVVAESFHHHTGGQENGSADQSHTQGAPVSALPSPNPLGQSVPVAGCEGAEALPHARRHKSRGAEG